MAVTPLTVTEMEQHVFGDENVKIIAAVPEVAVVVEVCSVPAMAIDPILPVEGVYPAP